MPTTQTAAFGAALTAVTIAACTTAGSGRAPRPSMPTAPASLRLAAAPQPATPAGVTSDGATADPPSGDTTVATVAATGRRPGDVGAIVAVALPAAADVLGAPARAHLHLEGIDWPGPNAAVATVLSLDVRTDGVVARRVAVPVSLVDGWPIVAGPVLELPGRSWAVGAASPRLATSPLDDPRTHALARGALEAAGWDHVEIEGLEQAIEAWPTIVRFTAVGADGTRRGQVAWLRRVGDRLTLAGLPIAGVSR